MSEAAIAVGGANGVGVITEEMKAEATVEIAKMTPEQRQKMLAELTAMQAMLAAGKSEEPPTGNAAPAVVAAPTVSAPEPAPTPTAPTGPALAPDLFPDPSYMKALPEIAYLWSEEAILKSAYLVTHDEWKKAHPTYDIEDFRNVMEGDKIKRFRPLDGTLLDTEGGENGPRIFKWIVHTPLLVASASGKIVESKGPTNVVAHACHALYKLMPLFDLQGCAHTRIRPMGWQTGLGGEREWLFQIWVEPDEADPRKPKLVSLESAIGKSAR